MEIGLGATGAVTAIRKSAIRLNPCFSGNRFGSTKEIILDTNYNMS